MAFYEFIVLISIKWHSWILLLLKWWRKTVLSHEKLHNTLILFLVLVCFVLHMQIFRVNCMNYLWNAPTSIRLILISRSIDIRLPACDCIRWWNGLHLFNLPTSFWSDWVLSTYICIQKISTKISNTTFQIQKEIYSTFESNFGIYIFHGNVFFVLVFVTFIFEIIELIIRFFFIEEKTIQSHSFI